MNKERLIKMAEFLEKLPEHKFDFSSYVHLGSKSPSEALANPEEHCGTTACAIGWLPAMFPESFKWVGENIGSWGNYMLPVLIENDMWSEGDIRGFLGINFNQYDFLFVPDSSPLDKDADAKQVAKQIREFVSTDGEVMDDYYRDNLFGEDEDDED